MDCSVCLTVFTKKIRTPYICAYCDKSACLSCFKKYIVSTPSDPHCLHCRKALTTDIVDSIFSKNFRKNELRKHRIQLLMEQERSIFPETIIIVEREDVLKEYLDTYEYHKAVLLKLSPRDSSPIDMLMILEINEIRKKLLRIQQRINEIGIDMKKDKVDRRVFIRKCPSCNDGLLSSQWKCINCKTKVCKNCLAMKGKEDEEIVHTCKQEDVESAKTIESETKPCPSCGVRVEKSEGCNQMWCTSCNNAFDWKSGLKVNGPVHNPHFHEFIRGNLNSGINTQQQWQNACENNRDPAYWPFPYGGHLINLIQTKMGNKVVPSHWTLKILDINRLMIERSINAHAYLPYSPNSYEDLRKKRLRKLIDDSEWSRQLSIRETQREKRNKMRLLDELILAVCRDTFGTLLLKTLITESDLIEFLGEPLDNARMYYNTQLKKYCEDNESDVLEVNERWIIKNIKYK